MVGKGDFYRAMQDGSSRPGVRMSLPKVPFGTPVALTGGGIVHLVDRVFLYRLEGEYRLAATWKCATRYGGTLRVRLLAEPPEGGRVCDRCIVPSWVTGEPMVYFAERGGLIKIGCSRNPARRVRRLKARLLAVQVGDTAIERGLHDRFSHLQHQLDREREWFDPGPELLAHIANLMSDAA